MATTEEQLLIDAIISHQVDLTHFSNGAVRRMIALLNRADADVITSISNALERLPAESFTVQRLENLLVDTREIMHDAYDQSFNALREELGVLADSEAQFQLEMFGEVAPAKLSASIVSIDPEAVYAAALSRPFQGRLLSEWAQSVEEGAMTRIRDEIRKGYVEGQTNEEMIRTIRGTRAANYEDGIMAISRRNAESVVRTAVAHTAAFTRDRFMQANSKIINSQVWVSTLDDRTTPECQDRDQLEYTLDGDPIGHDVPFLGGPPIHWNCRSCVAPVIEGLGLDLSGAARASMDGPVPATMSFKDWLVRQTATRQDEIMGPTRGKLMRDGGLVVDKFYNNKGAYLTLDQLREKNSAAFGKAGV